jgi:hypothetical protein
MDTEGQQRVLGMSAIAKIQASNERHLSSDMPDGRCCAIYCWPPQCKIAAIQGHSGGCEAAQPTMNVRSVVGSRMCRTLYRNGPADCLGGTRAHLHDGLCWTGGFTQAQESC